MQQMALEFDAINELRDDFSRPDPYGVTQSTENEVGSEDATVPIPAEPVVQPMLLL